VASNTISISAKPGMATSPSTPSAQVIGTPTR
jgi:hypothetical protein